MAGGGSQKRSQRAGMAPFVSHLNQAFRHGGFPWLTGTEGQCALCVHRPEDVAPVRPDGHADLGFYRMLALKRRSIRKQANPLR